MTLSPHITLYYFGPRYIQWIFNIINCFCCKLFNIICYTSKLAKPNDIFKCIKRINSFSNTYIMYRIMLTISLSIVSAQRKFLKLIKSYLRLTIIQERLNWLTSVY